MIEMKKLKRQVFERFKIYGQQQKAFNITASILSAAIL